MERYFQAHFKGSKCVKNIFYDLPGKLLGFSFHNHTTLLGKIAKAHHGVEGGADEEDHDGVEEDVAVDDGEGGVEGEEHAGQAGRREAGRQLPDGEEA